MYVINAKDCRNTPSVVTYTLRAITYQSFGLDKKIDLQKQVYFLAVTNNLDAYIWDEILALKSHLKEIPDTNKSDNHKNKMK